MSPDPKYEKCRLNKHLPIRVTSHHGDMEGEIYFDAVCSVCGANLSTDLSPGDWDATWEPGGDAEFCPDCEEALPHCTCPEER